MSATNQDKLYSWTNFLLSWQTLFQMDKLYSKTTTNNRAFL